MKKVLSRVVPIAVVIAVVVGIKLHNKGKASDQVREQVMALVREFPGYAENQAYYDEAFLACHAKGFEHSYKIGGRRTSSSFDEKRYLAILIALMKQKATEDGKTEICDLLEEHRADLSLPKVQFE